MSTTSRPDAGVEPDAPRTAVRTAVELRMSIVRLVVFGYATGWLLLRGRYVWDVTGLPDRRYQPIGLLTWLPERPAQVLVVAVAVVTTVASAAAAVGRNVALSGPVAALGMLIVATYTSSFGQIFHTEHLLVLHLLVLAVHAVAATRADEREWLARWALGTLAAVTAATYVVAGVAKLRMSGVEWVTGDVLRDWVAVDNLRKLLLEDPYSPVGARLAGVDWVWTPVAVLTLAVELGAPVILLVLARSRRGPRVAVVWAFAAWLFHVGVLGLMAISFPYQLTGVAYAFLLPLERLAAARRVAPSPIFRDLRIV